jgi:hypothetical protein
MNLLMTAPLCDSRGKIRYFIGAQVDVSGLVKECAELESLQRLLELQERGEAAPDVHKPSPEKQDEFQELCEMFNMSELTTVRKHGGRMHTDSQDESDSMSLHSQQPRLLLKDPLDTADSIAARASGKLGGVYQNVSHPSHTSSLVNHRAHRAYRETVSSRSPLSISPHTLCLALAASARHPSVALS